MTRSRALTAVAASALVLGSVTLVTSAGAQPLPTSSAAKPVLTSLNARTHGCHYGASIVGTWRMTIAPKPKAGPTPPPFPSLVQFARGGTMTDSVSSVPANPALAPLGANGVSSGLGAWSQRCNVITFAFEHFITANGKLVARQRIKGTTTVSNYGMVQSGPAVTIFFDTHGKLLGHPVPIKATGWRMMP